MKISKQTRDSVMRILNKDADPTPDKVWDVTYERKGNTMSIIVVANSKEEAAKKFMQRKPDAKLLDVGRGEGYAEAKRKGKPIIDNKTADASNDFKQYFDEVNKYYKEIISHVAAINKIINRLNDIDNHLTDMDIDSYEETRIKNHIKAAAKYPHDYIPK